MSQSSPTTPSTLSASISPADLRAEARRLLKALRAAEPGGERRISNQAEVRAATRGAMKVAMRFRTLRSLANLSLSQILSRAGQIQLKHALTVLALEHGYESWVALKLAAEAGTVHAPVGRDGVGGGRSTPAGSPLMYEPGFDVLLNRWFATYEEALASLADRGGYLLPYRHQFLICEPEAIRLLGLDPADPDWQRIGYDWVEPVDREAWERLRARRIQAKRGLSLA